ncbi:MAG: DUF58 domain-containing protein [Pseudonocardiaceae bacterium]
MRGRLGSLTTRGRCLLAAGLAAGLCAVLVNERDLLRIAAFAIMLPLLASVVTARTRISLQAQRALLPSRTSVGDECQAHLTLHVTGRCSGRLLLEDVVPQELGGPRRAVVARPLRQREVQLIYRVRPAARRVHSLGPLIVRVTDPLGLAQHRRTVAGNSALVVLPTVVPLAGLPAGGELGAGAAGGGSAGAGPGQDAVVVRSYRQGDDLRRVHWRTSARRDELMVRVEEWSEHSGVTVLLDHRAAAHRGAGASASLEYAVSLTASVYVHLRQRGSQVRLITADGAALAGAANSMDIALDALAALRATEQRDLTNVPTAPGRQDVVAVLGAVGPAAVEQLLAKHLRAARGHAVLLDVAAWATDGDGRVAPNPAKAARLLTAAGWSVTVARPGQSPSAVWEQLCTGSHGAQRVSR